ncbi:MAG TPA: acetoin utilization protein AcuC [Nitrospirota bacterium]|jgi:acetoin utilization protein AcuC
MPSAFIHSDYLQQFDYGEEHPLKMLRLKLTYELLKAYGLFEAPNVSVVEMEPCTRKQAELVHNYVYLDTLANIDYGYLPENLMKYGMGHGDCPAFKGVYEGSMLSTGGSVQAARLVVEGGARVAFNTSGGLHHAFPSRAAGFCYINDPAVAVAYLVSKGYRVAYIDIDAHHGDGIQQIFYHTDQVLTISLHENGHFLFPGTGFPEEYGAGFGKGYSINLPLMSGTGDDIFTWAFMEIVPPLIDKFSPDVIVTQLGCDTLADDPLTHLRLSTHGFVKMIETFKSFRLPWVALGGGGYNVPNVARAWALAFSVMAGVELPDELPESYIKLLKEHGLEGQCLRDPERTCQTPEDHNVQRQSAEEMLVRLKREAFPLIGL